MILAAAFAAAFLLTALVGVWAAYDRSSAWPAFALMAVGLLAATAIVWAGRRWGEPALGVMSLGAALLAGAIGVYFLLAYDWSAGAGEIALLQRIGLAVQAWRPTFVVPTDINANVAASGLTVTLFLGLGGLAWTIRQKWWTGLVVAGLAWLAGLAALILTQSRGVWISVGAGMAAILYLALRRRWADRRGLRIALDLLALAVLLALLAFFVTAVRTPNLASFLGSTQVGNSAIGRATLWRDGLGLIGDYPFTGSGLRSTMMVYSTYGLLIHVGFILHMHNLFVQIAVEQGIVALLGICRATGRGDCQRAGRDASQEIGLAVQPPGGRGAGRADSAWDGGRRVVCQLYGDRSLPAHRLCAGHRSWHNTRAPWLAGLAAGGCHRCYRRPDAGRLPACRPFGIAG